MECNEEKLEKLLFEILREETGVAGVPVIVVERQLIDRVTHLGLACSIEDIRRAIERALDEWLIDKTIDEIAFQKKSELGLPEESGFTWHLKVLTPEQTERYRTFRPEEQALIRLLRTQNEPKNLGRMPKEEAIEILKKQGFSQHLDHLGQEDVIEVSGTSINGANVWCYGIVQEWYKTDDYKQSLDELSRKSMEKEIRLMRLDDEDDVTSPIYKHLDDKALKREEEMGSFWDYDEEVSQEEWDNKENELRERDAPEEAVWESIIEKVRNLSDDDLDEMRKMFRKKLPKQNKVLKILEKKGL